LRSLEPRSIGSTRRALDLDAGDRVRALRAYGWLIAARVAVRLAGYGTVTRAIARIPPGRSSITPAQCTAAIRRASRMWPAARCLPQAVAGYCLLRRGGHEPIITVGVAVADGQMDAHAWLECDGATITGGSVNRSYTPLAPARRQAP
jgi:hypothetical protein